MKKSVITILALALVIVLGWYAWQNRHEVFFQGDDPYETADDETDEDADRILQQEDGLESNEEFDEDSDEEDSDEEDDPDEYLSEENEYSVPVIDQSDCKNKCEDFLGDELDYCDEICGFSEDDPDRQSDNCEDLKKLERDACYKQKAVDEKDAGVCKNISDGDLQENCENRVLEEILK